MWCDWENANADPERCKTDKAYATALMELEYNDFDFEKDSDDKEEEIEKVKEFDLTKIFKHYGLSDTDIVAFIYEIGMLIGGEYDVLRHYRTIILFNDDEKYLNSLVTSVCNIIKKEYHPLVYLLMNYVYHSHSDSLMVGDVHIVSINANDKITSDWYFHTLSSIDPDTYRESLVKVCKPDYLRKRGIN